MTANRIAIRIIETLGQAIRDACAPTGLLVPESFVAGLVSVENAALDPQASRFEPHVYSRLQRVRDSLLPRQYNGIRRAQIEGTSDAALRNLATSWGFTQIMGWHVLVAPLCSYSVADLRSPDRHLELAVRLLIHDAGFELRRRDYASALRIWNTGRRDGKTHDPRYVQNALGVMEEFRALQNARRRGNL